MSNYGIQYMGSKSKICDKVCALFPKADHFYDLFGGGFSITHFLIKHRRNHYKQFHFNELRSGICDLIQDAIAGKYSYDNFKPPWVSREDFLKNKDHDIYKKIIWSFGNNGRDYLFGENIEGKKKSMHMAIVFNEFDDYAKSIFGTEKFADGLSIKDKRLYLKNRIKTLGLKRLDLLQLQQLERLEQLQQLERLEQLEQSLKFYNGSYDEVKIEKNSVIYCDIPYGGTVEYDGNNGFNRKKFFDWAHSQVEPVFISEYNVEDSRFKCISSIQKRSLLSADKSVGNKSEKVYINKAGWERLKK